MSSILCKLCAKPIKFDDKHVSSKTGRKIPLDPDTDKPHDCPVWKGDQQYQQLPYQQQSQQLAQHDQRQLQPQNQQERRYYQCNKGCGNEIYFDANNKSQSGKFIPLDKDTGQPHQCQ